MALLPSCIGQQNSREANQNESRQPTVLVQDDTIKAPCKNVMVIYQDKKSNYWFGSWESGLYKYDGKSILHFTTADGLPHNRVEEIREDEKGNLYINTSGGLCRYDGKHFSTLLAKHSDQWKLQQGDLWFKSLVERGRVFRYDGQDLYSLKFPTCKIGEEWMAKHPANHDPHAIYTVYKDSKDNIWFGTAAVGVCRYNGKSFDWISEEDVHELHYGPSNGVRSVVEDKEGYFWFNSAYRYNIYGKHKNPGNTFYEREKSIGNIDRLPDSDFWEYLSIARDNNNDLWIVPYMGGVWRYDGKNTTNYPLQVDGEDIKMFYIYKDNHGDMWLGTHENGAYRFNGKTFVKFKP